MIGKVILQKDETDCAVACISSVARHYGKRISLKRIRSLAQTDRSGTLGLGLVKTAAKLGFNCRAVFSDKKEIADGISYPFIAHTKKTSTEHYIVANKFDKKSGLVEIMDPAYGNDTIKIVEFQKLWTGYFFMLSPTEQFADLENSKNDLFRFFSLLKPHKKICIQVFIASLILSVFGILAAFYFRFLIDEVLGAGLEKTLTVFSIGFFGVICFQALLMFARNQLLIFMGHKIDTTLMVSYFTHVVKLPMSFFAKRKTGEILSRMYDSSRIRNLISSTALSIIMDSVMIVFGGGILFLFGSKLLFISIASVLIGALIVFLFVKPYRRKIKLRAIAEAERQSCMVEMVNGIETVKSIAAEEQALDRAEFSIVNAARKNIDIRSMENLQNSVQYFVEKCGMLAIYWIGSINILKGTMSLGQLISFIILSGYFLGPLFRLLTLQPNLQEAKTSAERLAEILDQQTEDETENTEKLNLDNIEGNIEFKDVSFCYGSREETLKNINLKIKAGSKVAFVGESGSGKSTVAKLLMKFHKADKGEILIDGQNIDDYKTDAIRNKIGYVPQEILLFSGSIADNIRMANPNVSMQKLFMASIMAKADKFIRRIPERYATIVGERGATLSGGERQRIAIARVILKNPGMFILDEGTSGLDNETEQSVMRNLNMLFENKTSITISHKLSTVEHCDKIFVFDKGKIIEEGTHSELINKAGKYYDLWNIQNTGVAA
ncbi:MAG: peptidase C39 [Treponema sp.]|nr:MAG: peptidase C39 [Treponema sp.]